jgi:hypothetical protein
MRLPVWEPRMNQHNRLFHLLQHIALPSWEQYQSATEAGKTEIKNHWRNAWRDDEAFALLRRAASVERIAHQKRIDAESAERIRNMPTPIGPLGGYRNPRELDNQEVDHPRAIAAGDTWEVNGRRG